MHALFVASLIAIASGATACSRVARHDAQQAQSSEPRGTASALPSAGRADAGAAARRILADTSVDVYTASPSPDGKFLAITDWEVCDLAVRDLERGTTRRLGVVEKDCETEVEYSVFSRDGRQIAYQLFGRDSADLGYTELRVAGVDSTPALTQLLLRVHGEVIPKDWTPDGRNVVAVIARDNDPPQLAMLALGGGRPRILKTFSEWHDPGDIQMHVSRDGRFVAYSFGSSVDDGRGSISLLSTEDGRDIPLFRQEADESVLGWTADGSRLVIASDRGGSPGIWTLAMGNGSPNGGPRLVRGDIWRMEGMRVIANGDVFYIVQSGDRDIFVAAIDLATGQLRSKPNGISRGPGAPFGYPAWSPDGKFVAYTASRSGRTRAVVIQSVEGDQTRELRPSAGYVYSLSWMPDGRALALMGADAMGRQGLQRLDLRTGALSSMLRPFRGLPVFSRDGREMYYVSSDSSVIHRFYLRPTDRSSLVARELATGRERVLYVPPPGFVVYGSATQYPLYAVTPDQRSLVVPIANGEERTETFRMRMMLVPTDGDSARQLFASAPDDTLRGFRILGFSDDRQQVVFWRAARPRVKPSLWRVPLAGGPAVLIGRGPEHLQETVVSPDGRRVAYPEGSTAEEIWVFSDSTLKGTPVGAAPAHAAAPPPGGVAATARPRAR